eukprot:gene10061-biopygen7245
MSKMDKNTYPTSNTRASAPLAIIHIDMSGIMKVPSLNGSLYFQGILDDSSKYSSSTFHKTKDTVPEDTIAELERYENLLGKRIGKIFGDNAIEYSGTKFSTWCRNKGITQEFTVPGNPATNGAAERLNRTIHDRSTALLLTSKFPNMYWAEMVKSANTLRNLSPSSSSDKTPYEMFYGTKPNVDHLRIIGCTAYVQIPVKSRDFKFAPSAKITRNEKEALSSEYSEEWIAAMTEELTALSDMKTWSLADLPLGSKAIGTKWVFDLKRISTKVSQSQDMMGIGFKEVDVDQGLFILPGRSNRPLIWVLLWVDDFLLLSFDEKILLKYKTAIMALYKIRDLGEPSVFVGYEISRNKAAGTLHTWQSRFIKQPLKSHHMLTKPGSTRFPIPLQPDALLPYHEAGTPESGLPLAQIVGSLNYLAVNTRPDIAQAVNRLARHNAHPLHDHMEVATGIWKYLASTPGHGIIYTSSKKLLTGYCDSDHAACPITRKSTTGWVFLNQGGAVAWASKIQSSATALSSTEAEDMAASSGAQKAMWLRKLQFCATGIQRPALTINGDNQAALSAWNQEKLSTRLRHIDTRFHFLKEEFKKQGIRLNWIPTAANMADMFTKALPLNKFCDLRTQIGCLGNAHKPQ